MNQVKFVLIDDLAARLHGFPRLTDLIVKAETFKAYGVIFLAASVEDIIRSKEAAGRPKDREDVAILRAMQRKH